MKSTAASWGQFTISSMCENAFADLSSGLWNVTVTVSLQSKIWARRKRQSSCDSYCVVWPSCVPTNTTCTVSSQWLEASEVHIVQSIYNHIVSLTQYMLLHEGLAAAPLMWTSVDLQGCRCSSLDGQAGKQ